MVKKLRLDQALVQKGLVSTRSQAENYIKLGYVTYEGQPITKPGQTVKSLAAVELVLKQQYVSRAALKLTSVAAKLKLGFKNKLVLDVGSSTGGFTDFALQHGAKKVVAVDVGTKQLHQSLRANPKIELHEQTDIRNFKSKDEFDLILIDVSFISLREVLPAVAGLSNKNTTVVAMLKPQFEASAKEVNKGVVKNEKLRRQIIKEFEQWSRQLFVIVDKTDSAVAGAHGNLERFYLLKKAA